MVEREVHCGPMKYEGFDHMHAPLASQQITASLENMGARPWKSSKIDPDHTIIITDFDEAKLLLSWEKPSDVKDTNLFIRSGKVEEREGGLGLATGFNAEDLPKWKKWLTEHGFPETT